MLFLCLNDESFIEKEKLQWYQIIDKLKSTTNSQDIDIIYRKYQDVGAIVFEIAGNYFTSEDILSDLTSVKGIKYAKEIRRTSKETLDLKKIALSH